MRKTLLVALALLSSTAFAQGLSIGVGAIAGSYSASAGVAVNLTGPGTADANILAKNEGTASAQVLSGIQFVVPPVPLASTGTSASQNTTTVTPTVNLPVGGTGGAGGAGVGASFAAVGVSGLFVAVGPIPPLPSLLPLPPILGVLPAI
jgi:hypothetical protein